MHLHYIMIVQLQLHLTYNVVDIANLDLYVVRNRCDHLHQAGQSDGGDKLEMYLQPTPGPVHILGLFSQN